MRPTKEGSITGRSTAGSFPNRAKKVKKWETTRIGLFDVKLCSIDYIPFGGEKTYSQVVSRQKNKTGQTDVFLSDNFTYRVIAINDWASSKWNYRILQPKGHS